MLPLRRHTMQQAAGGSGSRRKVGVGSLVGLLAVLFFGLVLFQRMWTFHSALSQAQGNAAHLENLYNEALNEAADWRNKYDVDIKQVRDALEERNKFVETLVSKIDALLKEKQDLEGKVAGLKDELTEEKKAYKMLASSVKAVQANVDKAA